MDVIELLFQSLMKQDLKNLNDFYFKLIVYSSLFVIIFLENGFLPALFLPGNTILILIGILISKGNLYFLFTMILLIFASGLGYWLSYLQGKCLRKNKFLLTFPHYYYKCSSNLLYKYGFSILLIGRFVIFIRTILPIIAGLYEINNTRFQFFNWISALIWTSTLIFLGYIIGNTETFFLYEKKVIFFFTILSIIFLLISLIWLLYIFVIKKILYK